MKNENLKILGFFFKIYFFEYIMRTKEEKIDSGVYWYIFEWWQFMTSQVND